MTWNQPQCDDCWVARNAVRVPHRLLADARTKERCAFCGRITRSGIYVRADPATVKYPASS